MAEGVEAILERRRSEQTAALGTARHYATRVADEVSLVAAVVFGSYARGDFNTWSDIDVLVISDGLPDDTRARLDLLWRHGAGPVSPVGWTQPEYESRRARGDPIAVEAEVVGITVAGALPAGQV
jgi:hypothetical protein